MKAILEFNLDDHEERKSHLRAVKATYLSLAIWDIVQAKKELLYGEKNDEETVDRVYEKIWSCLECNNIDFEELCG